MRLVRGMAELLPADCGREKVVIRPLDVTCAVRGRWYNVTSGQCFWRGTDAYERRLVPVGVQVPQGGRRP